MKPTAALLPFGFFGADRRSWRVALLVFALACLPFGWLWWDWLRAAIINPTNGGLLYSVGYIPVMCCPLVAWAASSRYGPDLLPVRTTMQGFLAGHTFRPAIRKSIENEDLARSPAPIQSFNN